MAAGWPLVFQIEDPMFEVRKNLTQCLKAAPDVQEVHDRELLQAFPTITVLCITQFLAVIVDRSKAADKRLQFSKQAPDRRVANCGVAQVSPVRQNIVVGARQVANHPHRAQPLYCELQGKLDRVAAVEE